MAAEKKTNYQKILDSIKREDCRPCDSDARPVGQEIGAEMLVYGDGYTDGSLGLVDLSEQARTFALDLMNRTGSKTTAIQTTQGEYQVFVDVSASAHPNHFGAVHIAIPLVKIAKECGFRVKIVDGREKFLTKERFPEVDELILAWPDEVAEHNVKFDSNTYVVVLTHDEKFDDPAMETTLPTAARYIGAIGSRTTTNNRIERLRDMGFTEEQIARIHGPIGVPIGAREPAEIAVSIMAEIIGVKYGVFR